MKTLFSGTYATSKIECFFMSCPLSEKTKKIIASTPTRIDLFSKNAIRFPIMDRHSI